MQHDFFSEEKNLPRCALLEHPSDGYGPRTADNARLADVTVAFAVDFTTSGERLTHKKAGDKYVAVPYGSDIPEAAEALKRFMQKCEARTLNVAGNGLSTLSKFGVTQETANKWVTAVLTEVLKSVKLRHLRSGGQTGIDTAGLVAGLALGIPVTGLYPKGFRRRLATGVDVASSAGELILDLDSQVANLRQK